MIYLLEEFSVYKDTWKMTFYFIGAAAILIGLFWTYYQQIKREEKAKKEGKYNSIYTKDEDVIESMDYVPIKKKQNYTYPNLENHYDVYQNDNKLNINTSSDRVEESSNNTSLIDSNNEINLANSNIIQNNIETNNNINNNEVK